MRDPFIWQIKHGRKQQTVCAASELSGFFSPLNRIYKANIKSAPRAVERYL